MTTATDIYDICSLYFVQAVVRFDHLAFVASCTGSGEDMVKKYALRCYMYVLSGRLIFEGVY